MSPSYDVFLSHSSADKPAVEELARKLQDAGIEPFLDKWHLIPGDPWQEALEEALDASRTCVVFLGPKGLGSWQNEEMRSALDTRVGNRAFRVIPVLLPGAFEPREEKLPRFLRRLTWVDFRAGVADENAFHRLVSGIKGMVPGPSGGGEPAKNLRPYRCMAQPPEEWVHRREYDEVLEALCPKNGIQTNRLVGITTALRGGGGFGKTALAQKLCFDERVREAYPDGILWVTMGEDLSEGGRLSRIRDLIRWWTDKEAPAFETVAAAGAGLRKLLAGSRVLVVIDDAWSPSDIDPLKGLESGSALLITTRVLHSLPETSISIPVDAMASSEAVSLLRLGFAEGDSFPKEFGSLTARLGEWALLLKLVNGTLRKLAKGGLSVSEALQRVNEDLDEEGFSAFDQNDPESRHAAASKTILVSVKRLSEKDRDRYFQLAIFPEDEDIPFSTLERYWELSRSATRKLCDQLNDLSLLRDFDQKRIRLHDVTRRVLIEQHKEDISALHLHFLSVNRPASGKWQDLSEADTYSWKRLGYHLMEAKRKEELRELLSAFLFLEAKLKATDINNLVADYEPFVGEDQELRLIRDALRLSTHVLARDRTQLSSQLFGRLRDRDEKSLRALVKEARSQRRGIGLWPRIGSLIQPGGALIRILEGHRGSVTALATDGQRAISASGDRNLRLWSLETGQTLRILKGHEGKVNAVALLDDRHAVSASDDKTIRLWDLETGMLLRILEGHEDRINSIVLLDSNHAISASDDQTLRVWDLGTGKILYILKGHTGKVNSVAIVNSCRILSGSNDRTLRLWDLREGKVIGIFQGHKGWIYSVAVIDGRRAVSASDDGTHRVWDLETRQTLHTFQEDNGWIHAVAIVDDQSAISAYDDRTLRVWDLETGQTLRILKGHTDCVNAVAMMDSRRAVSASNDWTLRVWDLEAEQTYHAREEHSRGINAILIVDSHRAISASSDKTLRTWDLITGRTLHTFQGHSAWVSTVWVDGQRVISGGDDHEVMIWDLETGQALHTLKGHTSSIRAVAIINSWVVSASSDKTLRVWDLVTGQILHTLSGHKKPITALAAVDGRRIISASQDSTLRVWDLETGQVFHTFQGHAGFVNTVVMDGRHAVSASDDRTLRVWDLETGQTLQTLEGHTASVRAVVMAGRRAVSASDDRTLRVWDLETGQTLQILEGHTAWVRAVAMVDGRRAVSASDDRTLRMWDLESGEMLTVITLDAPVLSIAATLDGKMVVAGDSSGIVRFFDLVKPE